ncbi:MAG: hypothetical protein RLZZ263_309 [Cyanobacteriota bacterium]
MAGADPFAPARLALERGDYGLVLRSLEPLISTYPPATVEGAELQLLLATAWMGQGQSARAMVCCRQAKRCADASLRAQAKDLLAVLEAPALERPREWSITLPSLGEAEPIAGRMKQWARGRRRKPSDEPPPPPVGPTQAPLGFAAVLAVLVLVGLLLGGCVDVHASVEFKGPGRLQIGYQLRSEHAPAPPWQRQFSQLLQRSGFHQQGKGPGAGPRAPVQSLQAPVMPAGQALALLQANVAGAAALAGVAVPPPSISFSERNWLVGVHQRLEMAVDLRGLQPIAGVHLSIDLAPVGPGAVHRAEPEGALVMRPEAPGHPRGLRWPLHFDALNRLELTCWRWSPLGLGAGVIALALVVVLVLQRLRLAMGFGLPQLPA